MALKAALIITGIAIALLFVYGADVSVSMGNEDRDPVGSAVMLFAPAIIQLALGAIKIKKSSR